jgi:hypothetical protein
MAELWNKQRNHIVHPDQADLSLPRSRILRKEEIVDLLDLVFIAHRDTFIVFEAGFSKPTTNINMLVAFSPSHKNGHDDPLK